MTKKRVILFLMLQTIKKMFSLKKVSSKSLQSVSGIKKKKIRSEKFSFTKGFDGAKQLKEMGKLGGKLILM